MVNDLHLHDIARHSPTGGLCFLARKAERGQHPLLIVRVERNGGLALAAVAAAG
jgi:hypothetical protein